MKKTVLVVLCVLLAVPLAAQVKKDRVIVVVPFQNSSLNRGLDYLTLTAPEVLTTYLSRLKGNSVVERDQLGRLMDEKKLVLSGFGDTDEFAVIGRELNADSVLAGSFTTLGKFVRIDARLIDIAQTKILATYQVTAEIGPNLETQISGLAEKIRFSISGESFAILNVNGKAGAQVLLDGRLIGVVPLTDRFIETGQHTLTLSDVDYADSKVDFTVTNGEIRNLAPVMTKLPRLFQFSLGLGLDLMSVGQDTSISTTPGVGLSVPVIEVFYRNFSLAGLWSFMPMRANYYTTDPSGNIDKSDLPVISYDFQASLRYYPWAGFFTPYVGVGAAYRMLDLLTAKDYYKVENQAQIEFLVDLGFRINMIDEHLSFFVNAQGRLPSEYVFYDKAFSIFGRESYTEVKRRMDWFGLTMGLSLNVF